MKALLTTYLLLTSLTCVANAKFADADIREAAEQVFAEDQLHRYLDHELDVTDGIVTLQGSVESLVSRRYIIEKLQMINGVRGVVDRLFVKESDRSDDAIRDDLERLLSTTSGADVLPAQFKVNDGVVTLTGTSPSLRLRDMMERTAESIVGVRSVTNLIRIEQDSEIDDAEIQQYLDLAFANDPWIGSELVKLSVSDGVVEIAGAVDSAFERQRILATAQVYGAREVDADNLKISTELRPAMDRPHPPYFRSDNDLKKALELTYKQDPRLNPEDIEITVADGEITLTGAVPSIGAKASAEADAINLPGAEHLFSFLRVSPDTTVPDETLRQNLELQLNSHALLEAEDIGVDVSSGVVTLKGSVDSKFVRRMAVRLSAFLPGTQRVVSKLRVEWETKSAFVPALRRGDLTEL